jgi:hypothetical protein
VTVPIYVQAPRLRDRLGWEMRVPGGRWPVIVRVDVKGPGVLITVEDGTVYRVGYVDAVRVRAPEAEDECDGAGRPT